MYSFKMKGIAHKAPEQQCSVCVNYSNEPVTEYSHLNSLNSSLNQINTLWRILTFFLNIVVFFYNVYVLCYFIIIIVQKLCSVISVALLREKD